MTLGLDNLDVADQQPGAQVQRRVARLVELVAEFRDGTRRVVVRVDAVLLRWCS